MNEYKHYERLNEKSQVILSFSDAFKEPLETDICVNEDGGRHYNPNLFREDGLPKYKYVDGERVETSDSDFTQELICVDKDNRILEIIVELKSLDYKSIKRMQGYYTEEEWQTHKDYCKALRDEMNELK
jgi:hypothetical protein